LLFSAGVLAWLARRSRLTVQARVIEAAYRREGERHIGGSPHVTAGHTPILEGVGAEEEGIVWGMRLEA
jgi:hypothetical protein